MIGAHDGAPAGYERAAFGGPVAGDVVCLSEAVHAVAGALSAAGTLYAYAERHPERRAFRGRAPAYAAPLPNGAGEVVVRHAWHGGLLRGVTRDLYLPPTRAPRELRVSEWLRAAGVRTPRVVAYARYHAPLGLRRADVATALVRGGRDLAAVLLPAADDGEAAALRESWVVATAELLTDLARLGVRHPDLNLKNVLVARDEVGVARAWVLDVDVVRVVARPPSVEEVRATLTANHERLERSLGKWGGAHGVRVPGAEVSALFGRAAEALHPGPDRRYLFAFGRPRA